MGQPGHGAIALTLRYFPLAFLLAAMRPVVTLNGHPVAVGWGARTVLPVGPGQHHVHVHVPYLMPQRIGPADLVVPVHPGQLVELEYRAPVWNFSPGSLGVPPQKYNGMAAMWVLAGVSGLLLALLICLPVLAALG